MQSIWRKMRIFAVALAAALSCGSVVGGSVTIGGSVIVGSTNAFRGAWPIPFQTEVNGATPTVYTRPFYLPSDVTSITPLIRNAYSAGGVGNSFLSNVALYKSDGTGAPTGTAFMVWAAVTIPGDSTDWNGGSVSITRGADGKIVELESLPAGTTVSSSVTPLVHGTYSSNTSTVNPPPAPNAADPTPITWHHFDYQTSKRRIIVIGDSICAGAVSATGFEISFPYQVMVSKDYALAQLCLPGSALSQWAAFTTTSAAWWADGRFAGADGWLQAGVNDIGGGSPSTMEANATTIVNHLRALGINKIYANTIAPTNGANEATRTAYNTWLLANSLNLTAVADFAKAQNVGGLADNADLTKLFAAYNSGDNLHWTDAGHTQAAALMSTTVQDATGGFAAALFLSGLLSARRAKWRFIWQRPANDNERVDDDRKVA
jgi:hypothetical protein